ncbi:RTA1-domain-containing protein [Mollisia scopiformis]|uniref:RTA1-domain-containing protein n=1 Tax=Mollisia scopiformis TaxID=149040 RepID=A0A132B9V4_MOLSC|nr:RTA1-domain-containing protein [Mollisia scopiformis]KUJ09185.1 RTA1-domain-containing protein [Mollisia scopiformis]
MSVAGEKYYLYHYNPSRPAAIVFIACFAITTLLHTFQLLKKRTWYFIPFLIGGFFETLGYVGRALNAGQTYGNWTTGPYIMQSLLLLLAPALFAASIYMVLGRIIVLTDGEAHSPIRVKWLTKVFVAGDVISFLAQSGGGGMLAKAKSKSDTNTGEHVITVGLGIQVLFFGLFIIVAGIFNYRLRAMPSLRSKQLTVPWQSYLFVLYGASLMIMIRSVFRIAEYVMGQDGFLLAHEYFLHIFDATLMFLTMVLFNVYHPSRIITKATLKGHNRDPESQDSRYELRQESVAMGPKP